MDSDLNIRTATVADLHDLMHLWQERQVILNQSDPRIPGPSSDTTQEAELHFRERMSDSASLFIGDHNTHVVGYITGTIHQDTGIVDAMALDAHQYVPGLARSLWHALHERWIERGVQQIAVCLPRYDTVAQAFWRALGAKRLHEIPPDQLWTIPSYNQWLTL